MKTTTLALLFAVILSACAPAIQPTTTPIPPTATPIPPTTTPIPPTATPAPTQAPQAAGDIKTLAAGLDAQLQKMTTDGAFSGVVLAAQNGQVILSQGYGFADRENKVPNTAQTKYRIGSLTKQFTAMAILILQEQGKLTVQDKFCTYLADCPDAWKPITIYQLLTHSSGIPDTFDTITPVDKMIANAKAKPLDFQPGSSWSYCNVGYGLLGKIIEAVSGQTYEAFVQKNILEPLQLSNTGYDHGQADLALGYSNAGTSIAMTVWDPQALYSFGALYSTAEDLYRWDQSLYTPRLVSQKALDAMFTAQVLQPNGDGWAYGYAWDIGPATPRFICHNGRVNGSSVVIYRYPDDKAVIVVLINQDAVDEWSAADMVAKTLFGK